MHVQEDLWSQVCGDFPQLTADDLLRLPKDKGKHELYEGVLLREMSTPGHGEICQRLGGEIYLYMKATRFPHHIVQNALFDITPPNANRKTVLAPDISITRLSTPLSWTSVPKDIPLLAIGVLSYLRSLTQLAHKAQTYRHAGVEEVWLIDHQKRLIEIWNAQGTTRLDDTQTLASALLPGFSVAVAFVLDG